jgi:hypothetical protein
MEGGDCSLSLTWSRTGLVKPRESDVLTRRRWEPRKITTTARRLVPALGAPPTDLNRVLARIGDTEVVILDGMKHFGPLLFPELLLSLTCGTSGQRVPPAPWLSPERLDLVLEPESASASAEEGT